MPSGTAAEMFEARFHVDDRERMLRLHHSAEQMPHRGMGTAHSSGARVIHPAHEQQPYRVRRGGRVLCDDLCR